MMPEKCGLKAKKDEDLIRVIDVWKREQDELRRIEPGKPPLDDDYKLIALKSLVPDTGEIRGVLSIKEHERYNLGGYQLVEDEVVRWATKKKAESVKLTFSAGAHSSTMEVDAVQSSRSSNEEWNGGGPLWSWDPSWQGATGEAEWAGDADALGEKVRQ